MYNNEKFFIFSQYMVNYFFEKNTNRIKRLLEEESENQIINVSETRYIEHLVSKYTIGDVVLHFDDIDADSYKKDIPASSFPREFHVEDGKKYKKQIIVYHIPYSGNKDLLFCSPGKSFRRVEVYLKSGNVCFEIINFKNDKDKINKKQEEIVRNIKRQLSIIRKKVEEYNANLLNICTDIFKFKKSKILNEKKFLSTLNVPIRTVNNVKETYAIPVSEK